MTQEAAQVTCARWPDLGNWETLVEVSPEPFHAGLTKTDPAIVIKQHRDTKELMIEVFDCEDGLDVTYTNGAVQDKERSKWFRDIRTCRKSLRALRVRFLARGAGSNLRLNS